MNSLSGERAHLNVGEPPPAPAQQALQALQAPQALNSPHLLVEPPPTKWAPTLKFRNRSGASAPVEHRLSRSESELRATGVSENPDEPVAGGSARPSPAGSPRLRVHTVHGAPMPPPLRPSQASSVVTTAPHLSVVQKTHSFFNALKSRWTRSRSRERRRRDGDMAASAAAAAAAALGSTAAAAAAYDSHSDYAADNSSEYSSSATQSPRRGHLQSAPPPATSHQSPASVIAPIAVQDSSSQPPSAEDSPLRFRGRGVVAHSDGSAAGVDPSDAAQPPSSTAANQLPCLDAIAGPSDQILTVELESQRRRVAALRQHSFFQLRVHLRRGRNLVAMDKGGTSDPYVKFKAGGRLLHKSRTIQRDLNPVWDESFTLPIEDPFSPVYLKVFDYDWGLQDDFMGSAQLDLTSLDLGRHTEVTLPLQDPAKVGQYLGELILAVSLWPKTQEDKEQSGAGGDGGGSLVGAGLSTSGGSCLARFFPTRAQYFQRNNKLSDVNRRLKSQIWSSVVTIVLVDGKNLPPPETGGPGDLYCKFRLGQEKYKSKVAYKTLNPSWLEQFDLHMYDDQSQELEVTVWDKERKDECVGRCVIDLTHLERESTHRMRESLDLGGTVFLLLTISGTTASETISDLTTYEENVREREALEKRYCLLHSLNNLRDVGHLTVKVYRATGLAAADLGGKSDPFCVLELVNARLQTQTEYKTLAPSWNKIFTFNVKDMNSVLEITVFDEDRDHKVEFLGRLAVPLIRIHSGEKRWYCLKDKNLASRAKGNNPQILLEMTVVWNPIRASIRSINPKEKKYMQSESKFKRQVFVRNVMRLKTLVMHVIDWGKYIQGCFEWESPVRSAVALVLFFLGCLYLEPYMVPVILLLIFLRYYVVLALTGCWGGWGPWGNREDNEDMSADEETEDEDEKEKEGKMSLKERLHAIQEVTQTVQNAIGYLASLGESVKNTFNFTVPFLSYLAILMLVAAALVLYWVPARYLILAWGINKFARKLIRPHTVPNNEVLDLLSRVPDDVDLISFRELKPLNLTDTDRRRDQRKKHKGA